MSVSLPALSGPALLPVYAQMPVRPVQGRGSWLTDEAGEQWLDAYGGHAVASTGHSHPDVVRAIAEQAGKLLFYSAAVPLALREQLAERLASLCPEPLGKVFLCNSGAEANENALALARKRTGRRNVVSVKGGWHGRTPGVLACTDGARYEEMAKRSGIPLSTRVEFNDIAGLEAVVDRSVAAVIVEPVQGIQGARDCSPEFLRAAREVCSAAGAALIFDEIQCGTGRCGAFTTAESYGVVPDALTMAKGLAAGLPAAATVIVPWLAEGLTIGDLGSTFGGGPVICAAALANLDVIERERLVENAIDVGAYITQRALEIGVSGVQGRGLLIGLRFTRPAAEIQKALFAHRIITGTSADPNVLRLMPPLSFSRPEADLVLDAMAEVL